MKTYFETIGQMVLEQARAAGISAEVYLVKEKELSLTVENSELETWVQAEDTGVGLRLIRQNKSSFAFSGDLSQPGIRHMVEKAQAMLGFGPPYPYKFLAGAQSYPELPLLDAAIDRVGAEAKTRLALAAQDTALALDQRIEKVETAGYAEQHSWQMVMNSQGVTAYAESNGCGLYAVAHARDEAGGYKSGSRSSYKKRIEQLDPGWVGREAGERALRALGAKTIFSGSMPCVLEPGIAAKFLGLLSTAFSQEQVNKGKSFFQGREGELVAAPLVDIWDDGLDIRGTAYFPFDGEGQAVQTTPLISQGVLRGFLYNSALAQAAERDGTGNSRRASFQSLPVIGVNQLVVQPGALTPEQLIGQVEDGLWLTEVMGMHTANPITGEFSLGAGGVRIQGGQLTHGVKGVTIAGNLQELLLQIRGLGSDLHYFGRVGTPSWLIDHISVGGI